MLCSCNCTVGRYAKNFEHSGIVADYARNLPNENQIRTLPDFGLACVVWLGTPVAVVLCYLVISPAIGGLMNALHLVISLGTDATRLEVATTLIVGCRCLQTTLEFSARKKHWWPR